MNVEEDQLGVENYNQDIKLETDIDRTEFKDPPIIKFSFYLFRVLLPLLTIITFIPILINNKEMYSTTNLVVIVFYLITFIYYIIMFNKGELSGLMKFVFLMLSLWFYIDSLRYVIYYYNKILKTSFPLLIVVVYSLSFLILTVRPLLKWVGPKLSGVFTFLALVDLLMFYSAIGNNFVYFLSYVSIFASLFEYEPIDRSLPILKREEGEEEAKEAPQEEIGKELIQEETRKEDFYEEKVTRETLNLDYIIEQLKSNIEVDLKAEAEKLGYNIDYLKNQVQRLLREDPVGFLIETKVIPIERFIEMVKNEVARGELTLRELSEKTGLTPSTLAEKIIRLIEEEKI